MWIPYLNGIGWRMETMKWNRIQRTKWELHIRLNNRARENQQHLSCVFYYNSVLYLRGLVSLCSLQSVFLSFFCCFVHVIECFFNAFQHEHSYKYSLIFSLRHRRSTNIVGLLLLFYYLNQTHRHFWKRRQRSHNEYDFFLNGSTNISAFSWSTAQ